jgi:RNA polymerase sigma factor (sigma-70 family)
MPAMPEESSHVAIRVALVEDDKPVRASLAVLIDGANGFSCVCACATAEEALRRIPLEKPDVVLMDINLPKMSGIECVRRLKATLPATQIIMLTMYEDDHCVFDSLVAGASGYLLKRTPHVQILESIRDVHQGGSPMTSSIARRVVRVVRQVRAADAAAASSALAQVTPREEEILTLLSKGYRYKEIAEALHLSVETIRTHLRRIYEKLHVSSRTEAVVKFLGK